MSKTKSTIRNEKYRIPTMVILVGMCCLLAYYFHWVLGIEVVFSHFFYVPIILAAVWWKKKGLAVPLFLALSLLVTHNPSHLELDWSFTNDLMRAALLIIVGVTVSILSERMEKADVRLRQYADNLERMVAERTEDLRETRDHLDNLIRYANAPIIVWNPANEITIFNQAFEKLSGRTEAEMMGQPLDMLFPEDSRADCLHKVEVASKGEYWETVEIPILRRDGEIRIGLWNSANIYSEDGKTLLSTVAQGQDITERVQAQESLQESEERYRTTFESTGTATVIVEEDTTISLANTEFSKLCGYSREEVEGKKSWTEFVAKDNLGRMKEYHRWRRTAEKVAPGNYEFRFIDRWGNAKNIFLTIAMIPGTQKSVASLLDITERVRSEETLRALNTAAATVQRAARTPEAVFTAVMEQLHAVGLTGAVALLDENRQGFTIRYTAVTSQVLNRAEKLLGSEAVGYSLSVEQLPIGGQILAGETVFVPDVTALIAPIVPAPVRPLMPSAMRLLEMPRGVVAPLSVEGQIIGFLGVSADRMTEADVPMVIAFANQMAAALENAHLFQAEQRGRQVAEALQEVGRVVNTSLDLDNVLPLILEQLAQVIQYDSSAVLLFDDDRLEMRAGRGFPNIEAALRLSFAADEDNLPSAVMRARHPLVIGDIQSDQRWQPDPQVTHIRGWIGAPLIVQDRVVGVLAVDSCQPEAYNQEDGQLVFAFAGQAAVAIQNAQLYEQAQREIAERVRAEAALRESEQKYRIMIEQSNDMIWTLDTDGNLSFFNQRSEEISGHRFDDWRGKSFVPLIREKDLPLVMDVFHRTLKGEPQQYEVGVKKQDGGTLALSVNTAPILKADRVVGTVSFGRDITKRKQAEEKIQRQMAFLETLHTIDRAISSSMDLTLTIDVILDQTLSQLNVDAADILLFDPVLQTLECAGRKGFKTTALQYTNLRLGQGLAGRAALEREMVYIPDLQDAEDVFLASLELVGEEFVAYYGVSLIAKGNLKGVLEIFHRSPIDTNQEWLDILEALATQTAIAIDNATLFNDLQRSNIELTLAYDTTLEGWATALELRDMETEGHSRRVTEMTLRLARTMGVGKEELGHVYRGALLHDIGKMGVPDSILLKPGPLNDQEWKIMRQHPVYARDMLASIAYLRSAMDIPYSHHEKWDGTGYPRGLGGKQIPLAARIFAIVDVWDALRSDRPYRKAWPDKKALAYIQEKSGKHFDPQVVEMFLKVIENNMI